MTAVAIAIFAHLANVTDGNQTDEFARAELCSSKKV